ncbi:MAG: carbonic anhydrase [Proteobacteria bacterium]|nr:carbonic anhydrase [Pseudomonadota bacterium]
MNTLDRLFLENKAWIQEKLSANPDFLTHLAQNRSPDIFWIGCSDSRLHADEITNCEPGEIIVHRNIGNQVVSTDFNLMGALEYAVDVLQVKHIIVCGHYRCRSIKAALDRPNPSLPFADKWLRNIKDVYRLHRPEIENLDSLDERWKLLVELNIREQVNNLSHSQVIQKSWRWARRPELHGFVYGLHDGLLKEVCSMTPYSALDPIYEYDLDCLTA